VLVAAKMLTPVRHGYLLTEPIVVGGAIDRPRGVA